MIPIIFIHYGDSEYLPYTLDLAVKTNPDKRVILLGDETNKKYERVGVEHYTFEDYFTGDRAERFEEVFTFIAGAKKRKQFWTRFVFKRWFCIYNFIKKHRIERFWTFDTDTLILEDLEPFEDRFAEYDCTEQCHGICMNGLINNRHVVEGYVDKVNELFQRPDYLEQQRKELERHPDWAFTEMRAYQTYKKEEDVNSLYLSGERDGFIFDENICWEDGVETTDAPRVDRKIKKLYFRDGRIYEKERDSGRMLHVQTINMSWVSLYLFEQIYYYVLGRSRLYGLFKSTIRSLKTRLT